MRRLSVFTLPIGSHVDVDEIRGYYIDLREKAEAPDWPPPWHPYPGFHRYIALGQWALATHERYVAGEGDRWLEATLEAARFLVRTQETAAAHAGAWLEPEMYPHTFRMRGPWISGMAQGHCASALVRAHLATGDEQFASAARRALRPLEVPTEEGGAMAPLDGAPFPEEYPTRPPSYVLNGALYALFGVYDVWRGMGDADAGALFERSARGVAENLRRWDTGYWSRYDLYPHRAGANVASASYHALHVNQLRAFALLHDHPAFGETADRWERYAARRVNRWRAFVRKGFFRVLIPRNEAVAERLPWRDREHASHVRVDS